MAIYTDRRRFFPAQQQEKQQQQQQQQQQTLHNIIESFGEKQRVCFILFWHSTRKQKIC